MLIYLYKGLNKISSPFTVAEAEQMAMADHEERVKHRPKEDTETARTSESIDGKQFVAFIAGIIRNELTLASKEILEEGQYYFLWGKESVSYHFDTI